MDIQTALIEAGNKISEVADITTLLNRHIQFNPVFAKQYSFSTGTPRYFEFIISDYPIQKTPEGEIDGFVNLVFNGKLKESDIQNNSALLKAFAENFNPDSGLHFSKGPLDVLDHSSQKFAFGSKLGIDLTVPFPEEINLEEIKTDYTPPEYITLIFTDIGIFTPSAVSDELIQFFSA